MTEVATFPYDVCGRTLTCRRLTKGQLLMMQMTMQRWRKQLDEAPDEDTQVRLAVKWNVSQLEVIESLIPDPDEVAFVEQQMLLGKVDIEDLMPILAGGQKVVPVADDEPRVAKKAARKTVRKAAKAPGRTK